MFKDFWRVSAQTRIDIRDTQDHVVTRGVSYLYRAVPPEETITFNLVLDLARRRHGTGALAIALHSRNLEGGVGKGTASGADLELAVEVAPGEWIDIVLQAKKFNPESRKYDKWDPDQNRKLIDWARANHRRAGMLLYNSSDPPFASPGGASRVFNLCCSDTVCHEGRSPRWSRPNGRSPLAVSLVLDVSNPQVSDLKSPRPEDISDVAIPWECLFCRTVQKGPLRTAIGGQPGWAADLIHEVQAQQPGVADTRSEGAGISLILGMTSVERDEHGYHGLNSE